MNRFLPDLRGVDWFGPCTKQQKRLINAFMRSIDDSDKPPIKGKFNATERAIERMQHSYGQIWDSPYSYYMALETEIGRIVNDPKNLPGVNYTR